MSNGVLTALRFEVANQRYGLDVSQVVEVVPAVHLRTIPGVPDYVAGVFCYRGTMVPVLDATRILGGTPGIRRFSTRVILVRYKGDTGAEHLLGLLVEGAAQGLAENIGVLMSSGISSPETPYLGKIAKRGDETIQLMKVEQLIPDSLRQRLFTQD